INEYMFKQAGTHLGGSYDRLLQSVNALFLGQSRAAREFQESLQQMSRTINPIYNKHSNANFQNQIRDEYIAINKANIIQNLHSGGAGIADLLRQTSLRTGRRNPEDVTTLSIYGSYYPVWRLQDALGSMGLGLSQESMGSPLQIW